MALEVQALIMAFQEAIKELESLPPNQTVIGTFTDSDGFETDEELLDGITIDVDSMEIVDDMDQTIVDDFDGSPIKRCFLNINYSFGE